MSVTNISPIIPSAHLRSSFGEASFAAPNLNLAHAENSEYTPILTPPPAYTPYGTRFAVGPSLEATASPARREDNRRQIVTQRVNLRAPYSLFKIQKWNKSQSLVTSGALMLIGVSIGMSGKLLDKNIISATGGVIAIVGIMALVTVTITR